MKEIVDTEERKRVADTICKKCAWRKDILNHSRCMMAGINDEHTHCNSAETYKTAYWRKKDRDEDEAKNLAKLVLENGITPKYKIGDIVWHLERVMGQYPIPISLKIRKIIASSDGKSYIYKVHGHTEYTYRDSEFYPDEKSATEESLRQFVESTQRQIAAMARRARRVGISLDTQTLLSLPEGTDNK